MEPNKNLQQKIDALEASEWINDAKYRLENKAFLNHSQAIALRILKHIRSIGLSQKDFADKLDVSPQQVNKWVKGSENFTLDTIAKIENSLGIQIIQVISQEPSASQTMLDANHHQSIVYSHQKEEKSYKLVLVELAAGANNSSLISYNSRITPNTENIVATNIDIVSNFVHQPYTTQKYQA